MKNKKGSSKLNELNQLANQKLNKQKEKIDKEEQDQLLNELVSFNQFKELIEKTIPIWKSPKATIPMMNKRAVPNRSLCVIISDVHIGKKVPGYDFAIFKQMLITLFEGIYTEVNQKNVEEVVLFLDGDIVDGESIYPGHRNFICMSVAEQAIEGAKLLADMILVLSQLCKVRVECIAGNHGRPGKKGETTLENNWDSVLYAMIKVHLKFVLNVNVNIHYDWKAFVKVQERTIMAFHGDDVIRGNPLTNLPNAVVKWSDMWRNQHTFDTTVSGHFHLPMLSLDVNGRECFMNGSFSPAEDYTEKVIKSIARKGQVTFIVEGNKIKDRNLIEL